MLHAKVNAVVLLRFVNEEIFQRIVAVGWGKRFFAELAVNPTCRMLRLRPYANELISRCALRTKEIDGFGHERLPQSWSPRHMSARRQCQRRFKHTADLGHSPLPMPSPPERRCLIFAPRLRVVCPTPDSWRAKFESSVLRGSVAGVSRRAYRRAYRSAAYTSAAGYGSGLYSGYGCPAYSNYWVPYGTSSAAPYGIYASSYAKACERLKSGYAAPYGPIFY